MKYLHNLFFILFASIGFLINTESVYGQRTYEIDLTGAEGWEDLDDGNILSVCPNTPYKIRIKTAVSSQTGHFQGNISNTNEVVFQKTGNSETTFSAGPVCSNGGLKETSTVTVKFLAEGQISITIFDYTNNPNSSCPDLNSGDLTNGVTYSFYVLGKAEPILAKAANACVDSDLEITATCSGDCTSTTQKWFLAGIATVLDTDLSYIIPSSNINNLATGGSIDYIIEIRKDHVGTSNICYDRDTITIKRQELPNITTLDFGSQRTPSTEICLDGSEQFNISCSGIGCPKTTDTDAYEWFVRKSDLTAIEATTDIISVGKSTPTSSSTASFTTASHPDTKSLKNLGVKPGTHDVFVIATNEWGCKAPFEEENSFIINDLPGVEIYHNNGDSWSNKTSGNTADICTGELLGLRANACDAADYIPANFTVNQTSVVDAGGRLEPNNERRGAGGDYSTPCSGAYFKDLKWRAWKGSVLSGIQLRLDASGSEYKAATGTANSIDFSTHDPSNEIIDISTLETGVITYQLEVTGHNGCTSVDEIEVNVQPPVIEFQAVGEQVVPVNTVIKGCTNTELDVYAVCSTCVSGFDVLWASNSSATIPNLLDPTTEQTNPVSSQTITSNYGFTEYHVTITDSRGCTNAEVTANNFKLKGIIGPSLTNVNYFGDLCDGSDLVLLLTGLNGPDFHNYNFTVYDGDPDVSGSQQVYTCESGDCAITNTTTNTAKFTLSAFTGQNAYQPINNKTYYVVAKTASCETVAVSAPIAVVGRTPNGTKMWWYRNRFCNNRDLILYVNLNGDNKNDFNYTWSVPRQIPLSSPSSPIVPNLGSLIVPFTNGSGHPFFRRSLVGARIDQNVFDSQNFDLDIDLSIEDKSSTCSQKIEFNDIKIIDCAEPVLQAQISLMGVIVPGFYFQAIGTPNPEFGILCEGGTMELKADIGPFSSNSTTAYSASYQDNDGSYECRNATYAWNTGETGQTISITATSASPDTIRRSVYIIDLNLDTTAYLEHEFVVSRGNINFYPQGDNDQANLDTAICENDLLLAKANCPSCIGEISYVWDNMNPVFVTDGAIYQTYQDGPPSNNPITQFEVKLVLKHGEAGMCSETITREIDINSLPTVGVSYNGVPVGATGASYLCDGEVGVLTANCATCVSSNIEWNTNETTPSINIFNQGGYYALIEDPNGCESITRVAIVVDALDGLNSAVIANPSEICAGSPVNLEVAPCVGCSYQWNDPTQRTVMGPGRIQPVSYTGDYYAVVTNAQNCAYPTAQLTINSTVPAIPNIWGSTDSVCFNQTAILWTRFGTGFKYQWYKNDGGGFYLISGAIDSSYTTTPSEVGQYKVAVIYPNGCSEESGIFTITLDTFVPNIYNGSSEICKGDAVELSTDLNSNWQYQWYRDGILIPDSSGIGSTYDADSAGSYYVEVTNYNLCVAQSKTVDLTKTTLSKPIATTRTPTICPGELGKLSVSLCSGCKYEWLDITPTTIAAQSPTRFNYDSVAVTGDYYAIVSKGACSEISDTVNITVNSVFTPTITSSSSVICNGRDANLVTQGCANCSYSWLKNNSPVLGSLNDTFHLVDNANEIGGYQVVIDYPNGCSDTSAVLPLIDGSYDTKLEVELVGGLTDYIICNGVAKTLDVQPNKNRVGTYFHTLFLNNTPVTGSSNIPSGAPNNNFLVADQGVYTVEVTNPLGCKSLSNPLEIKEVDVAPLLTSRATSNASSVNATAICTNSGTVYLEVDNCVGCVFDWKKGGTSIIDTTYNLLEEDFETGLLPWSVMTDNSTGWLIDLATNHNSSGFTLPLTNSTNVAASNDDACNCDMSSDYLVSPGIDLEPYTRSATVNFDAYYTGDSGSIATVEVSTISSTGPWITVLTLSPSSNWQQNISVNLTSYLGDSIWVAFHHDDNGVQGDGFAIDNVSFIATNGPGDHYTTQQGIRGTDIYIVNATNNGCTATSSPITIADLTVADPLNSEANATDTSICNNQSVTLSHTASTQNPPVNCTGCSFRWLYGVTDSSGSDPINGASNYQYITNTAGVYNLEVTTSNGCVDTSSNIRIHEVDPLVGLSLNFDTLVVGTPLASNGSAIDMNDWVFPAHARYTPTSTFTSYFTSTPFNATLSANAGLQGTNGSFQPEDSLAGYHLITYHYDTLGCTFTVEDILEVLPPAAISVTNTNPASVAYEACVGDDLVINTVNLDFPVDKVFAFDENGNYKLINIDANNIDTTLNIFGVDSFWSTTISLTVPDNVYASYFKLEGVIDATTRGDTLTSFVLIHNTDLGIVGLPDMLCSNGEGLTLFGTPTGGSFAARLPSSTSALGTLINGAFVADTLYPQQFNQAAYARGNQEVDIYYSYRESYTNGQLCPYDDTVSIRKNVKDVRLTNVQFNTISVSQPEELLTNLVYQTTPYAARPNKQPLYTSRFSGSFTRPAGNPEKFLPANAGVGTHALTYIIQNEDCINSIEDSITVVPAPTPISMPDTMCRNYGKTPFAREIAIFPYSPPTTFYPPNTALASFEDEVNIISIRGTGVDSVNLTVGNESYMYDPTRVTGKYDTLVIEYGFYRKEEVDSLGIVIPFDTLEYVVAQIIKPIYIEDTRPVNIIDTIVFPFYCQENSLHLLAGNPSSNDFGGGQFMLYGGTNQYQFGETLHSSVINPYEVNHLENATTTYDLVYVLNGVVCNNSDTMSVTIGKGLNPAFSTANGLDEFCDTDPNVMIIHNVLPTDTAIWTIGGIPQSSYVFAPDPLAPGRHVVGLQQLSTYVEGADTFVCSATAVDTFTIHALPIPAVLPRLENQYCVNDTIVDLIVTPMPSCPVYAASGHVLLDEKFNAGIPPSWLTTYNFGGKNWAGATSLPQGGTGGAAFIDTSQVLNNSWLVTKTLDLVAGHTYRLTYMARAGELDSACSGFCDASLLVAIGSTSNPASMGTQLDLQAAINNDKTYVRYVVEHYHDTLAGFVTGSYNIGFRSTTPAFGRSLRLDNIRMRDMTLNDCSLAGIGYMNGPGIHHVADSLYQFNPLAVPAGNVEVGYVYTDIRGCQDSLVFPMRVDTAPIVSFTDLPLTYCENEPTLLITGSPLGGEFTSTIGTNLVPVGLAVLDTANFPVNYETNTTGMDIVSYYFEDNNHCSETVHDTIYIVRLLDSMFIDSRLDPFGNGHCVNADSTILVATRFSGSAITNGVFYGSGVRNGVGGSGVALFYPDSAEIDMGHIGEVNIDYVYTTTTGCADTTSFTTKVHALPDLTFMNLPDSLCLNADSFQVEVSNHVVTGSMGQLTYLDTLINNSGQFTVRDTNGVQVPNFIQLFDTLYPYTADGYSQVNISYSYTAPASLGFCSSTIYDSVRIDSVPEVYFQGLNPYYCENEAQSLFFAFPAFSIGSGHLLIGSTQIDSSFFWIDPAAMVGPGLTTAVYPTYYTFTDTRGCRGEVYDTFEVRPYPRIIFDPMAQDTFCRQVGLYDLRNLLTGPIGGYFTDNLPLTSIQDRFYLNLNSLAGPRLVVYHYIDSVTQCQNQDTIRLYLFNSPDIDFTIYGGCAQMDISFDGVANNLETGIDSITRIWWDFEGNGVITNSHLDTSEITIPDITYQYGTNDTYNVTLNVENQGNCPATITKSLIVSPYYDLATNYFEDFNSSAGGWYDDQPISVTPNNVWTYEDSLTHTFIKNPNGFWVTMAADTLYEISQSAWVYSPCFDFTNSQRPMIAFDLWRDVLPGIDGAVLEFYNNTSNEWEIVGDVGEGIDWYQSDFILGRPGNQLNSNFPSGWTGRSNGSESARLRLDQFKNQRDIRFRLAFATSSQTVIDSTSGRGYEGVAFDNVWIGERTRNVLVEHFDHVDYVNANSLTSSFINQSVYNKIFNTVNGLDVILIQYQTEDQSLGIDPIFLTNTADLSAHQYQYSAQPNNIFVDGHSIGNGLSESLNQSDLDHDMLQFPDFDIEIATPVTIVNGVLSTSATVKALKAKDASITYITRVAVIQDSLTYVGNSHMLSVFRKMLPDNGGIRKTDGWVEGEQQRILQSLTLSTLGQQVPIDETQIEVIVFLQNANDQVREIYQAATTQDLNRYTGSMKLEDDMATEIFDLNVYPNPSSDLFNVEFDKALEGAYTWRLVDVTGRTLQTGLATAGTEKFMIDAERLVDGAYFFIINSDDNRAYAQRKLIVIK